MKICIVSCVKNKKKGTHKAKDLYTSSLFKKSMQYAEDLCDETYIYSAKHGIIKPDKKIKSYDVTIGSLPWQKRNILKEKVAKTLIKKTKKGDTVVFLTGNLYKKGVAYELIKKKRKVEYPLNRMKIGQRLKWLNEQLEGGSK